MQVLLIEDNEDDVSFIRARLAEKRDIAIRLERTDRPSDGLSRLENGTIDLVLLDLSLPDSQGLDTFSRIHACVPDVPIVVVTALDDEATAAQLMRMGAQDYLVKARLNSDVLLRAIRHAIERKQAEAELRKSQVMLAEAQSIAHLGNWEWDLATKAIRWSAEMCRIFGFTPG